MLRRCATRSRGSRADPHLEHRSHLLVPELARTSIQDSKALGKCTPSDPGTKRYSSVPFPRPPPYPHPKDLTRGPRRSPILYHWRGWSPLSTPSPTAFPGANQVFRSRAAPVPSPSTLPVVPKTLESGPHLISPISRPLSQLRVTALSLSVTQRSTNFSSKSH